MTSQIAKPPLPFARESFRQRRGWGLSECLFFCVIVLALAAVLWCGRFAYREGALLEGAKANGQAIARWADGAAAAHAKSEPFSPQECSALLLPPPAPPEAAASVLPEGSPVEPAAVATAESATPLAPGEARMVPVSLVTPAAASTTADTDAGKANDTASAPVNDAVADKTTERAPPTWQACREALFGAAGPFAKMTNPFNPANTVLGTKCERKSAATRGHVLVEKGTSPPPGVTGNVSWGPLEDKELIAKGLLLRVQVCDAGGYPVKVAEVTL